MSQLNNIKAWWRHAFAVENPQEGWSAEDRELAERLADLIVRRRLGGAALMALEAGRPCNFLGSQALTFLDERFTRMLERRQSIDLLLEAITRRESEKHE